MPRTPQRSGRTVKYGVCTNEKCGRYKMPTPITHGEFVCPECKKTLTPCAPPKTASQKAKPYIITAACIALIALVAVGGVMMVKSIKASHSEKAAVERAERDAYDEFLKEQKKNIADSLARSEADLKRRQEIIDSLEQAESKVKSELERKKFLADSLAKADSIKAADLKKKATAAPTSLKLSYGTYVGATKNGYPHGQGTLTYSTSRVINRNDAKGRTANKGDRVSGEFFNGFFVLGKHYDSSGNLIESLNIGVGSESSYESK